MPVVPAAPGPEPAQRASRTASASSARARRASSGTEGVPSGGRAQDERPGVEQGDPAAQHGGVVAVPGAQPPAGARAVAVHLDESGEAGGVPVRADLAHAEAEVLGGAARGGVGEGALAVAGAHGAAGAQGGVGPAGDPDRAGQALAGGAGEFGRGRCALRGAWGGAARRRTRGGGRQGLAAGADKSEPGVARGTGRHWSSLPVTRRFPKRGPVFVARPAVRAAT